MKVKIRKSLPKASKKQLKKMRYLIQTPKADNLANNKYLDFYDDIKIPSKRYDW